MSTIPDIVHGCATVVLFPHFCVDTAQYSATYCRCDLAAQNSRDWWAEGCNVTGFGGLKRQFKIWPGVRYCGVVVLLFDSTVLLLSMIRLTIICTARRTSAVAAPYFSRSASLYP